jgi:hypothetical protein
MSRQNRSQVRNKNYLLVILIAFLFVSKRTEQRSLAAQIILMPQMLDNQEITTLVIIAIYSTKLSYNTSSR